MLLLRLDRVPPLRRPSITGSIGCGTLVYCSAYSPHSSPSLYVAGSTYVRCLQSVNLITNSLSGIRHRRNRLSQASCSCSVLSTRRPGQVESWAHRPLAPHATSCVYVAVLCRPSFESSAVRQYHGPRVYYTHCKLLLCIFLVGLHPSFLPPMSLSIPAVYRRALDQSRYHAAAYSVTAFADGYDSGLMPNGACHFSALMLAIDPHHSAPLLDGALHPDEFVEDSDSKDVCTALSATADSMGDGQAVL